MNNLPVYLPMAMLLISACSSPPGSMEVGSYAGQHVQEVTLSDGTRCAVYQGFGQGGISCGWK